MNNSSPQKIYFDESGFTGNNLLNPNQELFSYASVATNDIEAQHFVEDLIRKYGIQGGELKGNKLVRFNKGRKALDEIFEYFENRIKISISNKKYALATKFFEYIFEPCISDINTLFYRSGFHRFISNILYIEFVARGAGAEAIFYEFEELMKSKDDSKLDNLFSSSIHPENSPIITQIREFAQFRSDDIREELNSLEGSGVGKWILDLTQTSLFTLLANWGTEHSVITAVCDFSKPLLEEQRIFDAMIGREDRLFTEAFVTKQPISFNLSGPIEFQDSKIAHGIQLADAVAAAAIYAFSGTDDEHGQKWRNILPKFSHYGSIIPDIDELDFSNLKTQRNAVLLLELHSRAKNGLNLIEGMPEYFQLISQRLLIDPIVKRDTNFFSDF